MNPIRRTINFYSVLFFTLTIFSSSVFAADKSDEKPICRIAAISNPYITALTAEQLGASRSFLAATGPSGLERSIATVNAIKPDALVVLGSLTWTGSDEDFKKFREFLTKVEVPVYLTPGNNDVADRGKERYLKLFAKENVAGKSINICGVQLQFAARQGNRTTEADKQLLEQIKASTEASKEARAVLLFGGLDYARPKDPRTAPTAHQQYWQEIHRQKIALRLIPGHSHYVAYEDSLPMWSIPSSGWSYTPKFSLALITVYAERIELSLIREPFQPIQTLVIPNPVSAERMATAADDPYGVPTFSEDLALKPDLTFVQLSDSQFDDNTVPRYGARYTYDEQMNELAVKQVNRLNPPMVFITGDLTNKNTKAEWGTFQRIYSQLKPTLYTLPGNHDTLYDRAKLDRKTFGDLFDSGVKNWELADRLAGTKTTDRTALYQHFMKREPYYTVEKNGCAFLCLNTGVASVDEEQMKWLRKELERTKSAKHVFVLGHYPVLSNFGGNVQGPEGQEILMLLRKYRVAAYLSGHRHRYDYRVHDGTAHVLCDCLCWGEYLSYQIYHVFPDRIVACWKPIFRAEGNRPLYERVVFPEPRYR